jgi:hypothetical protein
MNAEECGKNDSCVRSMLIKFSKYLFTVRLLVFTINIHINIQNRKALGAKIGIGLVWIYAIFKQT